MMISTRGDVQTGSRAAFLVAHQRQDGETDTGLRHTVLKVSLLLRPTGITEHTSVLVLKLPRETPERILYVCYN